MHIGAGVAIYIPRDLFIVLGSDRDDLLCNEPYEETNRQLAMHIIISCLDYHDVCFSMG